MLKSAWRGGRFVAVVSDEPNPVAKTWPQLLSLALAMLWRPVWTSFCPWLPRYIAGVSISDNRSIAEVLRLVATGKLVVPLSEQSPFPFTEAGLKGAFSLQESGHAHGKVIVRINDPNQPLANH